MFFSRRIIFVCLGLLIGLGLAAVHCASTEQSTALANIPHDKLANEPNTISEASQDPNKSLSLLDRLLSGFSVQKHPQQPEKDEADHEGLVKRQNDGSNGTTSSSPGTSTGSTSGAGSSSAPSSAPPTTSQQSSSPTSSDAQPTSTSLDTLSALPPCLE
ncbi:hypothetical protein CDD82_5582 [Ophiocordyceps australis]|uniref:Uncharacterized protein n=1 Tax=Ophiocordyceps australis TaxID=1399860 RepID=A0A2C5ZRS9_9HYPO|nr:hypothetical protein CDD82_5582 [Ophiocordyceps australis]